MTAILFNERADSFNEIRGAQQIVCGVTCYTKKLLPSQFNAVAEK